MNENILDSHKDDESFCFSVALTVLKAGKAVRRVAWHKDGFICLNSPDIYRNYHVWSGPFPEEILILRGSGPISQDAILASPWLVKQEDLFATDWVVC